MNKLEKIDRQEQKAREKLAALQAVLKQIDGARTEQENLQIIQQVRALKLSRDELYAFITGGELPPSLAGAIAGDAPEPETVYSRPGRSRRHEQEAAPEGEADTQNNESEDITHEE